MTEGVSFLAIFLETVEFMIPVYFFLLCTFAVVLLLWYAWPRLTSRDRGRITTKEYVLVAFGTVLLSMPIPLRWLSLSLWGTYSLAALSIAVLFARFFRPFFTGGSIPIREYAWLAVIVFCLPLLILSWFGTGSLVLFYLHGSFFPTTEGWAYTLGLDILLLVFGILVPLRQIGSARKRRQNARCSSSFLWQSEYILFFPLVILGNGIFQYPVPHRLPWKVADGNGCTHCHEKNDFLCF